MAFASSFVSGKFAVCLHFAVFALYETHDVSISLCNFIHLDCGPQGTRSQWLAHLRQLLTLPHSAWLCTHCIKWSALRCSQMAGCPAGAPSFTLWVPKARMQSVASFAYPLIFSSAQQAACMSSTERKCHHRGGTLLVPQLRSLATVISPESFDDAVSVVGVCLSGGDVQGLLRDIAREAQAVVDGGSATPQLLWCHAAAATYALRQCTDQPNAADLLDSSAAAVYLPLLRLSAAQPSVLAVQRHLASLMCTTNHWAAACAVLRAATDAGLVQVQGSGQAQPPVAAPGSGFPSAAAPPWQPALLQLPAHLRIQLAASMVEAALDSCDQVVQSSGSSGNCNTAHAAVQSGATGEQPSAQHVLTLVCGSAFSHMLGMLGRTDLAPTTQRVLARHLLPAALRAAERMGRLHECLSSLLATCRCDMPPLACWESACFNCRVYLGLLCPLAMAGCRSFK